MRPLPRHSISARSVYYALLALAVVVTVGVAVLMVSLDVRNAREAFMRKAADYAEAVSQRLTGNEAVLSGLLALRRSLQQLDHNHLSLYAREMLRTYPYISSIQYVARVDDPDRRNFEAEMRQAGFEDFALQERLGPDGHWQRAGTRSQYFPIILTEPSPDPNDSARLGYDLYSDAGLREAIDEAIVSGEATASPPRTLIDGSRGYLLFRAVYADGTMPATKATRKRQVAGLVAVVLHVDRLFALQSRSWHPELQVQFVGNGRTEPLYARPQAELHPFPLFPTFRYDKTVEDPAQPFSMRLRERPGLEVIRIDQLAAVLALCVLIFALMLYTTRIRFSSASARQKAREEIYRERERAEVTLYSIADGVITTDVEGRVEYMNPVAERLTGWSAEEGKGRAVEEVLRVVDETTGAAVAHPVRECLRQGAPVKVHAGLGLIDRQGGKYSINQSAAPIRDYNGGLVGVAVVFRDIGRAREMSRLLVYQATHDDLTGLKNRREFGKRVQRAIETAKSEKRSHVLCYLDLDQFKVINDTCGHLAGDTLVKEIAALLKPHVRDTDTLARLGGDEFGVLLEDCPLDEAIAIAESINDAVRHYRFVWSDKTFEVGVSIGIVHITAGAGTLAELMSFADSACYVAKAKGGNRLHVYQADDDALLKRQGEMQWVHRITQAYSENRFVLYAQEVVALQEPHAQEQSYEILLRMLDEDGQLVLPMEYISAAERYNMMSDLDRWVLSNALVQVAKYTEQRRADPGLPMKRFAINLSGQSLGDDKVLDFLEERFSAAPDLPPYVVFEITETAAIASLTQAAALISRLREKGCRFSLDDFGSGLSSFAYLKNLEVDYLKIDGEFVKNIDYDPVNYAIVASINQIGHVMGIKTIAEHVESGEIRAKLAAMGVDFGQGNWLREPVLLADVVAS